MDNDLSLAIRRADQRSLKGLLSVLASTTWLVGAGLFVLQGQLPLDAGVVRSVASMFLLASVGDALVLYLWRHIFVCL